ncbi:hypothetical protein, partial [Halobacterium bonnevillei]
VALGVPALVVFAVLPLALWRDARDVAAAGGDWPSDTGRPAKLAAVVDVAVIGGGARSSRASPAAATRSRSARFVSAPASSPGRG